MSGFIRRFFDRIDRLFQMTFEKWSTRVPSRVLRSSNLMKLRVLGSDRRFLSYILLLSTRLDNLTRYQSPRDCCSVNVLSARCGNNFLQLILKLEPSFGMKIFCSIDCYCFSLYILNVCKGCLHSIVRRCCKRLHWSHRKVLDSLEMSFLPKNITWYPTFFFSRTFVQLHFSLWSKVSKLPCLTLGI